MKQIFLIDSMAYLFRSFYGIRAMSAKDGRPTNAVYGFINSIEKIIKDFNPDQVIAVFDAGQKTFRNDIYPEYKANRAECPEDLRPQFAIAKEYLKLRGIPLVIKPGFEADDLIGTLAVEATAKDMETIICTGDKDMMQLINDQVKICQTHKDNLMVDDEAVEEIMGVRPDQIIDLLAMMGDSSDNVPGLPGIGAKGAAKLLKEYNDLETVFANKEKMKGKRVIEAVNNHQDLGYLSQTLVTIKTDVETEAPVDEIIQVTPDFDALEQFYGDLNMKRFAADLDRLKRLSEGAGKIPLSEVFASGTDCVIRMEALAPQPHKNEIFGLTLNAFDDSYDLFEETGQEKWQDVLIALRSSFKNSPLVFEGEQIKLTTKKLQSASKTDLSFDYLVASYLYDADALLAKLEKHHGAFAMTVAPLFDAADLNALLVEHTTKFTGKGVKYHLVNDSESLDALVTKLEMAKEICVDVETTSLKAFEAEIVGVGFSLKAKEAFYVPFNGELEVEEIKAKLTPLFNNEKLPFFGQNIKYDYEVLRSHGMTIAAINFDTLLASYVCNPSRLSHGIDAQALQYLNYQKIETKGLIGTGKKQISMSEVPIADVTNYCCEDVDICLRLKKFYDKELKDRGMLKLYQNIELPLIKVLAHMEEAGISVDTDELEAMSSVFEERINELTAIILDLAGEEFNINSTKQLGEILFEKLELPHGKKTKTGYSTDASVLEELAQEHEIARALLEYRSISKLKSTYIDALPQEVNPKTNRIHSSFSQATAQTGRLSSTNPNLQNIPTRTAEGKAIRKAFKARPGHSFVACDYSQIELRVMAELSQDPALVEAFQKDFDIHTYTASLVNFCEMEEVTKEQRYGAKAINFGIIYGQGPYGLAKELNVSADTAKLFIKSYYMRYPKIRDFMNTVVETARQKGYSETAFQRRRYIPEINHSNGRLRSFAERIAVNSPIQGSAADIIKLAMIQLDKDLQEKELQSKMILQIHDELIFEVPDHELEEMKVLIPQRMTEVCQLSVPLKVDLAIGKSWNECD